MKHFKKILSLLLIISLLSGFCVTLVSAKESEYEIFAVTESAQREIKIKAWLTQDKYFLFMPGDADLSKVKIESSTDKALSLNGTEITYQETFSLSTETEYTLSVGEENYKLLVLKSENIPTVHITTQSGSMANVHADKSYKEKASIVISSDGEVVVDKDLEYIKGRGNASWTYIKKPYNIKFEKKTDLFGMGKAKKWTLLANYVDPTLMRNAVAYNLAEDIGLEFTSKHISVDLYIDNEYYGNYLLCESVEVGETRVDIEDLEGNTEDANEGIELDECTPGGDLTTNYKNLPADSQKWLNIPNNPEDISGGYLLEYELPDRYINEPCGFVTKRNQPIVLKAPENASEAQVKYISAFYQEFEDAVYSEDGYNSLGKHYTEYIDMESFLKMYIFQEFVKNLDAGITSFYIYKDKGSDKFVAAPVWDFDRALGDNFSRFGMNTSTPDGWWAGIIYHWSLNAVNSLPTILNALYRHDDFFTLASKEWQNTFSPLFTEDYITDIYAYSEKIKASAVMNAIRWNTFSSADKETTEALYRSFVDSTLINFIENRKVFLDKGFSESSVRVFFDSNGGNGNMYNENAVLIGESLILPECSFQSATHNFTSWNTKSDGTGTAYSAGETVTLESNKLTLYAQWTEKPTEETPSDTPEEPAEEQNFFRKLWKTISDFFKKIADFFKSLF